jgi:hypothetical protein
MPKRLKTLSYRPLILVNVSPAPADQIVPLLREPRMVLYLKQEDIALKGEPSYETNLDTIDAASCCGGHSDRLLLEYLSDTREECCGMAYRTWFCRMKKTWWE